MSQGVSGRRNPKPVSQAFYKILKSYGLTDQFYGWSVINNWSEIVGSEIARRAKAVSFEEGCLYISIADDVWRQQLSMKYDELLKKIHSQPYGHVVKELKMIGRQKGFK